MLYKDFVIKKFVENDIFEKSDTIISEYPLTIILNDEELITLLCSPNSLEYLTIGFLLSEGFIKRRNELKQIEIDKEKGIARVKTNRKDGLAKKLYGKRTMTTGCGKGTIFYNITDSLNTKKISIDIKISAAYIINTMRLLNSKSELFIKTGGVHSCCLCDDKKMLIFHEDVGRHNAIDKIIGEAFMKEISLDDKIIFTSGRISSEILLKSAKAKIPMIVSRSAPTDLAVELARKLGIVLVGFVRGQKFNIYSGQNKIISY